jgi:hypothetical protein
VHAHTHTKEKAIMIGGYLGLLVEEGAEAIGVVTVERGQAE